MNDPDEIDASSVGRHSIETSVRAGGGPITILPIDAKDGRDHMRAEIEIEVSGAESDRPHTYELVEQLEAAVQETIETFDGADTDDGQRDPDYRCGDCDAQFDTRDELSAHSCSMGTAERGP